MSFETTPVEHQPQGEPDSWASSFWDARYFLTAASSLLLVVIGVLLIPYLGVAGLVLAVLSVLVGLAALLGTLRNMMDTVEAPVGRHAQPEPVPVPTSHAGPAGGAPRARPGA
jgi:hypothetical protein